MEPKKSGMVMAWPMPISRSRVRTIPAIVLDRQEKKAEPRTTAWMSASTPAAKALPVTRAARGVGVTRSLVRIPRPR